MGLYHLEGNPTFINAKWRLNYGGTVIPIEARSLPGLRSRSMASGRISCFYHGSHTNQRRRQGFIRTVLILILRMQIK